MAEQDGLLNRNVASIAEGPKLDHIEGRSLSPEQAKVFLRAVKGHRCEGAYVIALSLGLRRGEILGLSWSDIETAEGTVVLHVRRQLIRDKSGIQLVDLKTVGSRRVLHLSRPVVEMLERHRTRQEAEELVVGKRWNNEHELIFTSNIGTPLDPEAFGRTVPKICKEAGLGHWSIHELRHSCASLLIAMEVPLEAVAEQLGHASIRVTKDVYGHLMPRSRARAAEAMRTILYDDSPVDAPETSNTLATSLATLGSEKLKNYPLTRDLVGRPGLDPGTLGLKEGCGWSEWSGEVGIIRESKKSCPVASDSSGDVGMVRGKLRGISRLKSCTVQVRVGNPTSTNPDRRLSC
jgi:integrase